MSELDHPYVPPGPPLPAGIIRQPQPATRVQGPVCAHHAGLEAMLTEIRGDIRDLRGEVIQALEGRTRVSEQALALVGRAGSGLWSLAMRAMSRDVLVTGLLVVAMLSGGGAILSTTSIGQHALALLLGADAGGAEMTATRDSGEQP